MRTQTPLQAARLYRRAGKGYRPSWIPAGNFQALPSATGRHCWLAGYGIRPENYRRPHLVASAAPRSQPTSITILKWITTTTASPINWSKSKSMYDWPQVPSRSSSRIDGSPPMCKVTTKEGSPPLTNTSPNPTTLIWNGPHTETLITHLLEHHIHPHHGFRSCLGILRIGKSYPPWRPGSCLCSCPSHQRLFLQKCRFHP